MRYFGRKPRKPYWRTLLLFILLLPGLYVLSILWKVSVAEQEAFGRSELIPLSMKKPKYKQHPSQPPEAHNSGTFVFNRNGQKITVWSQKINGFQHIYGSALAAYDLGDKPANLLFCGNEYMEAYADLLFDKDGIELADLKDRRKDLHHNAIGRAIGLEAKQKKLTGDAANRYMQKRILYLVDNGIEYLPHYNDPRVSQLKTESQFGCPGLPPAFSLYSFLKPQTLSSRD